MQSVDLAPKKLPLGLQNSMSTDDLDTIAASSIDGEVNSSDQAPTVATGSLGRNLSDAERRAIYEFLLKCWNGSKLAHGSFKEAAMKFNVCDRTIRRIWKRGELSLANGNLCADVSSRIPGKKGRPKIVIDVEKLTSIDKRKRTTIRSTAFAMGVSPTTLHRRILEGIIKRHTNALKPYLTEENKIDRLAYCLSMINQSTIGEGDPLFLSQFDRVHFDEKWFYLTEESGTYYLAADEEEPHRTTKSKRFILKVMFLAAVARPRWDRVRNQWFTGRIGIWPFVFQDAAKRSSKNRPAGTLETKAIPSITKEVTKRFLVEKVFPAIRAKWPRRPASSQDTGPIKVFVQQDNARPHPAVDDPDLIADGYKGGFEIRMVCQPPNSPDMNVLDLGFFRAIQSLQHRDAPRNIDQLIDAVVKSFNNMERYKLNNVFLSLQHCMIEVLKSGGDNKYKLPHTGKDKLQRQGLLQENLCCPLDLYQSAQQRRNA